MDKYKLLDLIGHGTYGRVYRAIEKESEKILVIKEMIFDGIAKMEQDEILNEVKVMSQVNHNHIIKYYHSFLENGLLYIVMEYCKLGDLGQLIKKQNKEPFDENIIWTYLIQISQGLKYLHDKRILHRDLKPQNIFLQSENNIKIGDLGLGRILSTNTIQARSGVGTPLYFSPELCQDMPYDDKSDVWSLGCLIYELMMLTPPFIASNTVALAKKIVSESPNQPLSNHYSSELRFLVMQMLQKNHLKDQVCVKS